MRTDLVEKIPPSDFGKASEKAAEMLGINPHYVTDAKQIEQDAPKILHHVRQGTLTMSKALKVAALPKKEQPAAIERIRNREEEEGGNIYRDGKLVEVKTNDEVTVWLRRHAKAVDAISEG